MSVGSNKIKMLDKSCLIVRKFSTPRVVRKSHYIDFINKGSRMQKYQHSRLRWQKLFLAIKKKKKKRGIASSRTEQIFSSDVFLNENLCRRKTS